MQPTPDKRTVEKIMAFANSPEGQKLMAALQSADPEAIAKAKMQANEGNYDAIAKTLSKLTQSPELKKLMQEMGRKNG